MSEELEGSIAEALRAHGTGAVDVSRLRVGALGRARSIRRRRIGLASVGVAGVLIGVGATVPRWSGLDGTAVFGGASPSTSGPAIGVTGVALSLPSATQPGAAAQPDLVGKDPGVLHFDVDTAAIGATGIWFNSADGVESAEVWNGAVGHLNTWYSLAQKREDLNRGMSLDWQPHDPEVTTEVFGRPATLVRYPQGFDGKQPLYRITWQPVDGLWAGVDVEANDTATAMKAVFALKLNRSQRCAVPFRIVLPAGYRWVGCNVGLGPAKPWETSGVAIADSKGNTFRVDIGYLSAPDQYTPNATVGGRSAQWIEPSQTTTGGGTSSSPGQLFIPIQDWVNLTVGGEKTTRADAEQFAGLVDVGTNFTDLASWPAPPVS